MSERIRVSDETYAALEAPRGDGETFDDLLSRLVCERWEIIRNGAGHWEGTDAAEKAREKRETMKRGVGDR